MMEVMYGDQVATSRKRLIVLIGMVEMMVFSGTVFGWPSLVFVLKADDVFGSQPSSANDTAASASQDRRLESVFTAAAICKGVSGILIGIMLDKLGMRWVRFSYTILVTAGVLCIAYTRSDIPDLLFPGMVLLSLGGATIRQANLQIANLFPNAKSTIITTYNGAMCTSTTVFLIIKYLHGKGVSREWSFLGLGCLGVLSLIPTIFLLPNKKITATEPERYQECSINDDESTPFIKTTQSEEKEITVEKDPANTVKSSLCSMSYILHVYWLITNAMVSIIYQGYFHAWTKKINPDLTRVSYFINLYGFIGIPMFFIAPLSGVIMDYSIKLANKETNASKRQVKLARASFIPLLLTSLWTSALCICLIFESNISIYISFAAIMFVRPLQNSVPIAHLRHRFKEEHFNVLVGVLVFTVNSFSVAQYPWFIWLQQEKNSIAIYTLLAFQVIGYKNPLHLLCLQK